MHDILMLLPLIFSLFIFKNNNLENFENEKCDITEQKIKLLEEKIVLEKDQNNNSNIEQIKNFQEKIKTINNKLLELEKKLNETQNINNVQGDNNDLFKLQIKKLQKKLDDKETEELKEKDEELREKEKELKEKEEIYDEYNIFSLFMKDDYLTNKIIIFFIVFLIILILYLLISSLFEIIKTGKLKLSKINTNYDNIFNEIKKSKVKKSLKVKKGKFFNF